MTDKILLIAGCSNAAGFEITDPEDSIRNRSLSFGNILAKKLDRTPVNVAMGGLNNNGIVRTVLNWFNKQYTDQDVHVLISWTESVRVDLPVLENYGPIPYENSGTDWRCKPNDWFWYVNPGIQVQDYMDKNEAQTIKDIQYTIAEYPGMYEMHSWNSVLLLQNFFNARQIPYTMCNSMTMFTDRLITALYQPLVDFSCYFNAMDNAKSFYPFYRDLGYKNEAALYWHHGEEPHRLYAEELFKYVP